jgi:hypothetical protein
MGGTNVLWIVVVLATVVLGIFGVVAARQRAVVRTAILRQRFGPEYDRAVQRMGVRRAERSLVDRIRHVERSRMRELSPEECARFESEWLEVQALFADDPTAAVVRANELVTRVMEARGYAADHPFERRASDLSVDHPDVVEHYRVARALARRISNGPGAEALKAEDLRQSLVHYRVIFADLLQPAEARDEPRGLPHTAVPSRSW